jgi:PadR family transcriptional regulator, regulatory protein AphA
VSPSTCQIRHVRPDRRRPLSLRHALLGLLADRPRSGYDLTRLFATSLANVWSARHSQIYPELARLRAGGLVRVSGRGARGRVEYALTEAGLAEVRRWLSEPSARPVNRDEAALRSFFLWLMEPEQARAHLRSERDVHAAKLREYEALAARPVSNPRTGDFRIMLERGIRYERGVLEWADWALAQLEHEPRRSRRVT